MIAVVPVRESVLPAGTDDAIAECDGNVVLAGSGVDDIDLTDRARTVTLVDLGDVEIARWARHLAALINSADDVVLPKDTECVKGLQGDAVEAVFVEGADHSFNEPDHKAQLTQTITQWMLSRPSP